MIIACVTLLAITMASLSLKHYLKHLYASST